jgi:hypothetical protein
LEIGTFKIKMFPENSIFKIGMKYLRDPAFQEKKPDSPSTPTGERNNWRSFLKFNSTGGEYLPLLYEYGYFSAGIHGFLPLSL